MKLSFSVLVLATFIFGCDKTTSPNSTSINSPAIEGTWELVSGTIIENGDTTVTDYTGKQSMIKILNATHFSFLNHDKNKGKDSTASFSAGGGSYVLEGDQYTEYLEYCSAREWEGNTFQFKVSVHGDTLIQQGVEKIENLNVERMNIEKYRRVKG
jgi:tRNA(Ile2) C34 agmatinyltransferase TiaS